MDKIVYLGGYMSDIVTPKIADSVVARDVAVIGSGYVGLTLSASLALLGHQVECTDNSPERVAQLAEGHVPITESGLTELVEEMLAAGRLRFGTDNAQAAARAEFIFLCLPTPNGADGSADLSFVNSVAAEIGPHLRPGATVITKSTVPVGTSETVVRALNRNDVSVASNPEFLAEGSAVKDCLFPDRIVIGASSEAVAQNVAGLYGRVGSSRFIFTDLTSAELIKYASNAYLATRITFVNSIAELCEAVGADISSVMAGMGSDHRIGDAFLQPGPGWGGSCFPKDTQALVHTAEQFGCELELIKTAIARNTYHTQRVVEKVASALGEVRGRRIALLGLTFKAGTDDLRNSPAMEIAQRLIALGASVQAYDPTVDAGASYGMEVHSSSYSACRHADALVICTEWPEFTAIDLGVLGTIMSGRVIVDARNMLDPDTAASEGFIYAGIGIGACRAHAAEVAA
jgi:UDPglucose 6-dehydrogenase